MAIRALNLSNTKDIKHPDDLDGAPTLWTIGVLDSRVAGMIMDKATKLSVDPNDPEADTGVDVAQNEVNFLLVQFGLKSFSNFVDDEGDVAPRSEQKVLGSKRYDVMHSDVVSRIPGDIIQWLAGKINEMNSSKSEEGKS